VLVISSVAVSHQPELNVSEVSGIANIAMNHMTLSLYFINRTSAYICLYQALLYEDN